MKRFQAYRLGGVVVSLARRQGRPARSRGSLGRGRRRGFAMATVLLYTMAVVTLAAGLVRVSIARQRDFRVAQRKVQTEFLLAAGVARAQAQLSRSGDYRGESWQCEVAGSEGRPKYGQVVISVATVLPAAVAGRTSSGELPEAEVSVMAEYPVQGPQPVRRHRIWRVLARSGGVDGVRDSTNDPGTVSEGPTGGADRESEPGEEGRE